MADVFVSYARSTEAQAHQLAEALRETGFTVWRDDELPPHRTYAEVIEERLKSAKAVVVLWSAEAVKSQWVRAEADAARLAGTLVQLTVDGTLPPMPFNQIQCADLLDWDGDTEEPGWRKIEASVAALTRGVPSSRPDAAAAAKKIGVCVLPFVNMSGDPDQEYFSDGITEDVTTDLSQVSALEVTARNTAFTFKTAPMEIPRIARKLGVSHVLEGSVRKVAGRVRVTAQLIDGQTGNHVWAERFDRDLTDIFAIQDEISKAIVDALKVRLMPDEKKAIEHRGTTSAEAYDLFLLARQYWVTGNHGDRRREERVMRICRSALDIDPAYARAWALYAIAQANLRYGFGLPVEDGLAAAERALALDPTIAEVYCVKARHHAEDGRLDEAIAQIEAGLALDPQSWDVRKTAGMLFLKRREVEQAAAHFNAAVSIIETDFHGWGMLLSCCQALGDKAGIERAARNTLSAAERVIAEDPNNGAAIGMGVMALAASGDTDRAKQWMKRALLVDPDNLNMRYNFACTLAAALHDPDAALDMLGPALAAARSPLGLVEVDPDFESVRDHPRYKAMIAEAKARVGKS